MSVIKSEREEIIKAGNESEFKEKQTTLINYQFVVEVFLYQTNQI